MDKTYGADACFDILENYLSFKASGIVHFTEDGMRKQQYDYLANRVIIGKKDGEVFLSVCGTGSEDVFQELETILLEREWSGKVV